jgi:hypothetical protein
MDGAPEPIIADFVEALGQHMLQKAPDELPGRQGHGLPALILGILIAEAHVAVLARENPAPGSRGSGRVTEFLLSRSSSLCR